MYNRSKVRQNNLKQLRTSQQFLAHNNIQSLPLSIRHISEILQQDESDGDSSLWADLANMAQLVEQRRDQIQSNLNNIQNTIPTNTNTNTNYSQHITKTVNIVSKQNKNNINEMNNYPNSYTDNNTNSFVSDQYMAQYSNTNNHSNNNFSVSNKVSNYMTKSFKPQQQRQQNMNYPSVYTTDQQLNNYGYGQQSNNNSNFNDNVVKKQKKNKKQLKKGKEQSSYQNSNMENIITDKNNNLTTVQILKTHQPLTKNYRPGHKNQWENNKKIQDYKLQFVLRKFPGIKDFRANQKAIIKCSLLGNDVFVCMPTGGGKSLTFQVMTFIEKGIYLCIMPLVALIIDQEMQAKKVGVKAFSLTAAKQIQDNRMIYQQIKNYQPGSDSIVVFCTPEKVGKSPQFLNALEQAYQKNVLVKIVIDQVHCVSTWGKQFRQDYTGLSSLRESFPKTPILGLTATVTQVIKQDIIKTLGIKNCFYFQSSFNRPNLHYAVLQKSKDFLNKIIQIIMQYEGKSGIIYCISRKDCEQMCKTLSSRRFKVAFFHANIDQSEKRHIQQAWMDNKINIIIATIAFGMGINKPDVRFVIHHSLSKSLQNYYQQSGRAGRDGQIAKCILFYRKSDKISLQSLITKNQFSKDDNKSFCMKQLSNMVKYCQDKYTCRRKLQLNYLGQDDFDVSQCNKTCDNCKKSIQFVEVQCIKQAKILINTVMQIQQTKQNISQNQIIMLCKGTNEKKAKYKLDQIQSRVDIMELKQTFLQWHKVNIDQLLTELLSHDIFYQKLFTANTFKNNVFSNFYIKINFQMARKFLQKVQTLPMKRVLSNKRSFLKQTNTADLSDCDFEYLGDEAQTGDNYQDQIPFQADRYLFKAQNNEQTIQ